MSDLIPNNAEVFPWETSAKSSMAPNYFIEITFNFPRTVAFLRKSSEEQKKLYIKIWHHVISPYKLHTTNFTSEYQFEACKSGQIHLHGYVQFDKDPLSLPLVILSDLVKLYLNGLPAKYNKFKEANMYAIYKRYRCPSLCMQIRESGTDEYTDRVTKWKAYIVKDKPVE